MYICNDPICDPCCKFCWYCVHSELGECVRCEKHHDADFFGGLGCCDDFRCSLHEPRPDDKAPEHHIC